MKSNSFILLSAITFATSSMAYTQSLSSEAGVYQTLPYRIYVPAHLDTTEKVPLILFLHGAGERGNDNTAQLIHGVSNLVDYSIRTNQPFVLLAPQCPAGSQWVNVPWNAAQHTMPPTPSESLKLALDLVRQTMDTQPVDPHRIYVTGLSMGGFGTWDCIQRNPDIFAAAVPVCGGGDIALAAKIKNVPVWVFHGDQDPVVSPQRSRDMVNAIRQAGGWPRYTEYAGVGHDAWTATYDNDEVWDWLLAQNLQQRHQWRHLFNGKDLTGWHPKITGFDPDDNAGNLFRVEDGVIKVSYDHFDRFTNQFGHLFYKEPFSRYILRIEYRFVGEQTPGGPAWAFRNSGVMIHSQSPQSMGKDQDFPVSVEVQMLGGNGTDPRPTANVCTPGTNIVMNDQLITTHCTNSTSKTYHGDQWVNLEVEVHGSDTIKHLVNGEVVLTYEMPQLDENDPDAKPLIQDGKLMLDSGFICVQAESHPVEFRRVELLPLP